jgi:putative DNA primase/helicase
MLCRDYYQQSVIMNNFPATSLDEQHLAEFRDSAIADDITALNFRSFDGENENDLDEAFTLLIEEADHNNNGTLKGKSLNNLANTLRSSGWIFDGYNGICVKPNSPRKVKDENGEEKDIKYESPRGEGKLQLLIPRVSVRAGIEIAAKLGEAVEKEYRQRIESLSPDKEDPDFWDWYLEHDGFIIITEGAKKACSLVANGYPAIALNGVWGWGTNDRDMFGNVEKDDCGKSIKTIHPDLEPFLDGREIVLAFDRDSKPDTVRMVESAKSSLLRHIDGDDITVTQLTWRSHKGIDDYIAAKGVKALDRLYTKRKEVKIQSPKPKDRNLYGFATSIESGLEKITSNESDGKQSESREKIGNYLEAIAYLDNPEGTGAAILLEFKTVRNQVRKLSISRSDLAGDGVAILSYLMGCGYYYNRKNKADLLEYLHGLGADIEQTYTIVDSTGWVNGRYISQHKTYGDGDYVFQQAEPNTETATEIKGSLDDWKANVGNKCDNNSRLIFVLGIAFAAPLLAVVGLESGGFHLMGDTSTGKTTAVKVAVSVTGEKEIPNWRTTANGLEMTATAHNHSMLPLDEIGQADEKGVGEACYMLRNGQGKSRSTKDLKARKVKTWRLLFLSTGEHSLTSYMAEAGKVQKGGQEVGMPDIPAVPFGSPYGVFESIHGCDSSKEFAENLEAACQKYRGTAIDEFLARLVVDRRDKSFDGVTAARVFQLAKKLAEGTIDLAVSRVANRFALVQVALEIAHSYGILPFPVDRIEWAIKKMFTDWLTQRGGDGSIEIKQAIARIEHLLVTNEFSDRIYTLPDNDNLKIRGGLLAYRKIDLDGQTEELWVPTTVFDKEFCNGVNKTELVKELQRKGLLLPPRPDGKAIRIRKLKGNASYYYVFGKRENEGDTSDPSDTSTSNPCSATVSVVSPQDCLPLLASDTGDTYKDIQDVGITSITEGSQANDPSITDPNRLDAKVSDVTSPVSLVSVSKTQLGISISENALKVGDRVRYVGNMLQYRGKVDRITEIRGNRYFTGFTIRSHGSVIRDELVVIL